MPGRARWGLHALVAAQFAQLSSGAESLLARVYLSPGASGTVKSRRVELPTAEGSIAAKDAFSKGIDAQCNGIT